MENPSTENICCQSVFSDINNINNNNISLKDIIFGWDTFNARVFIFFIISFVIWSIVFFLLYNPEIIDHSDHGHGMMEHEFHLMSGKLFY